MKFRKYPKIAISNDKERIRIFQAENLLGGEFVVQEKVHGAHLSIYVNKDTMKFASRYEMLKDTDNFYNYKEVIENIDSSIKSIYSKVIELKEDVKYIIIEGELYGGIYPDICIGKKCNEDNIGKGVYYNPNIDFYAYDIWINGKDLLTVDECDKIFFKSKIFYAIALFKGSFEECINYKNDFKSWIPQWLKLPRLENNTCEGIVIKPVIPRFNKGEHRVIFKSKNSKWKENNEMLKIKSNVGLSEIGNKVLSEFLCLLTENRVLNLFSKEIDIKLNNLGELTSKYVKDVFEDIDSKVLLDFEDLLSKKEQKMIKKQIGKISFDLINKEFYSLGLCNK